LAALYIRFRGTKDVNDGKPWEAIILDDFAALRDAKLTHPLMDEIAALFKSGVSEPDTVQPEQAAR